MFYKTKEASILLAIIILTIGFVFGMSYQKNIDAHSDTTAVKDEGRIETLEVDGFTITAHYEGENQWEYQVTGVLPNKCVRHDVTEVVAESYPEQVTVTLAVFEPEDDSLCAQVLKPVDEVGEFQASEEASINFEVENSTSRPTATGLESQDE